MESPSQKGFLSKAYNLSVKGLGVFAIGLFAAFFQSTHNAWIENPTISLAGIFGNWYGGTLTAITDSFLPGAGILLGAIFNDAVLPVAEAILDADIAPAP